MPLFKSSSPSSTPASAQSRTSSESPRRSFFSSRRSEDTHTSVSTQSTSRHSRLGGGLFSRSHDPAITSARKRVASAEAAERDADAAKMQAKRAARDAKEEARRLEKQAAEEARLAKIKQKEAAHIGKRARPLGRHGIA